MAYTVFVLCGFQDVEICVFELQKILNRVVTRRKKTHLLQVFQACSLSVLCNVHQTLTAVYPHVFFSFAGDDIKTDGFSLSTCRNMVNLLDVSFPFPIL